MKTIFLLPIFILISCCASKSEKSFSNIESACPDDGKCTIEIIKNKSLDIKSDETGSNYYQLLDNIATSVIHYQYKRNTVKGFQDGNYTEEILFEITNKDTSFSISNITLQKTKMMYGRFCYCKGQTGYYLINEGNLKFKKKNSNIQFDLDFKNNKVPQIIQKISAVLK